jgi:hypothetical protein
MLGTAHLRPWCKRLNKTVNEKRVRVEHKIGSFEKYRVLSSVYRHPRKHIAQLVELIAGLVQRRHYMINGKHENCVFIIYSNKIQPLIYSTFITPANFKWSS